jgi:hypothetical protein
MIGLQQHASTPLDRPSTSAKTGVSKILYRSMTNDLMRFVFRNKSSADISILFAIPLQHVQQLVSRILTVIRKLGRGRSSQFANVGCLHGLEILDNG